MLAPGYTPKAVSRIVVATDGSLAAMIDGDRVVVVPVVGGDGCEVGLPTGDCDLGWLGGRLIVVARSDAHSTAYLIDVADNAPRAIAEIRLESAIRLAATVGNHALVIGARGPAILSASDAGLAPYQFMTRASPTVCAVAGGGFLVGLPGVIEEWDPVSRAPKRRFKLNRAGAITALGGTERLVWWQQEPTRIDVLPLINRGQPKTHELMDPISGVLAHPHSDSIACVSGTRLRAIDLDGRLPAHTVTVPLDAIDAAALVVSRGVAAIAACNGKPLALVSIDGRDLAPADARRPSSQGEREDARAPSSLYDDELPTTASASRGTARVVGPPQPASAPTIGGDAPAEGLDDLRSKLAAMRARAFGEPADEATYTTRAAGAPASSPLPARVVVAPAGSAAHALTWRDDIASWARTATFDQSAPSCPPVENLLDQLELPAELAPGVALIYGCHLAGLEGAAPVDLARVVGWEEALGHGELAQRTVAIFERSRIVLAAEIRKLLDDLP